MLDYLVVGLGLSGLSVCAHLDEQNRTFMVIADGQRMASTVAGGVYNPVVLKRLTPTWKGASFLDYALPFYRKLEQKLDRHVLHEQCILRRFATIEEQNNWFTAADRPGLSRFLATQIQYNENTVVVAPLGFGRVNETGRVDVPYLLEEYSNYLRDSERLLQEELDFEALSIKKDLVRYKGYEAKKMIFAMGYRALQSPWFNYLPIQGNKGEVLLIEAPQLQLDTILKATDFVIPLGNHRYKVGATYNAHDLNLDPTKASKSRLIQNLEGLITCSYTIIRHEVGIRPTVPDRRPLVGVHPKHSNLGILNGMGSRGVILAPQLASDLLGHMEKESALDPQADINRYRSYYEEA